MFKDGKVTSIVVAVPIPVDHRVHQQIREYIIREHHVQVWAIDCEPVGFQVVHIGTVQTVAHKVAVTFTLVVTACVSADGTLAAVVRAQIAFVDINTRVAIARESWNE